MFGKMENYIDACVLEELAARRKEHYDTMTYHYHEKLAIVSFR